MTQERVGELPHGGEQERSPELRKDAYDTIWWRQTAYLNSVQDAELLSVMSYDYAWIRIHQKVRALLDAQEKMEKVKRLSMSELYERYLKNGAEEIPIYHTDGTGEITGQEPLDLVKEAHYGKIKELNDDLGKHALKEEDLRQRFDGAYDSRGDMVVDFPAETGGTPVNLFEITGPPLVSKEEFKYYFDAIQDNQTQLQIISTYRDPAIDMHHCENAGHAQGVMMGGSYMYLPVGVEQAKSYVRGDVRKRSVNFRTECQSHEVGWYEENTSSLVKLDPEAYSMMRGGVRTSRTHEHTRDRTYKNLLGLSSGEKEIPYNKGDSSFHFGNGGKGDIYKAMHHHYDTAMERVRGFAITNEEIGDKIVTDIVGVSYVKNNIDFLMNLASVSSGALSQDTVNKKEFVNGTGEWKGKPKFIFDAKMPAVKYADENMRIKGDGEIEVDKSFDFSGVTEFRYGKIALNGVFALTNYLQWRVSMGEIYGISADTRISVDTVTPEEEERIDKENEAEEEKEKKEEKKWADKDLERILPVLGNIFGEDALQNLLNQMEKGDKQKPVVELAGEGEEKIKIDFNLQSTAVEVLEKRIKDIKDPGVKTALDTMIGGSSQKQAEEIYDLILMLQKKHKIRNQIMTKLKKK
ncbi:hypothetical protein KJ785_01155 [Patescibacteria group bacterium]|nr:hypothetical protein [Patescibacteria group bacterium]